MGAGASVARGRLYPVVNETLYSNCDALSLTATPPRWSELFWKRSADPETVFRRIVQFCRSAFEAEVAAFYDRADFYWSELYALVKSNSPDHPCWTAGRALSFPTFSTLSGPEFRETFLREVVLDSHVALLRGEIAAGSSPLERPRTHLAAIARLLSLIPNYTVDREAVLVDTLASEMAAQLPQERPESVERFWITLAGHFPRLPHLLDPALSEIHKRVMTSLNEAAESNREALLRTAIREVEALHAKFPNNIICYHLLAVLHHENVAATVTSSISGAYLELRKAEAFGGPQPAFPETRRQLDEVLTSLQVNAQRLRTALSLFPGSQATAEGQRMLAEADAGTRRGDEWADSAEAKSIVAGRQAAVAADQRTLAPGNPNTLPLARVSSVAKQRGQETFSDWLGSRQATRVRVQVVAAALLAVIAAGIGAREAAGSYLRGRAWDKLASAVKVNDDTAALDALNDYFRAPGRRFHSPGTDAEAARLYSSTVAHWLTSNPRHRLSDSDKERLLRYRQQIVDPGLDLNR